jgi:hypothetical protein
MKRKLVINENTQMAYISDDLIKEGYKGDIDILANFNTVTLLRPGSNIDDQILSLELVIQDLKMRKKASDEQNSKLPI